MGGGDGSYGTLWCSSTTKWASQTTNVQSSSSKANDSVNITTYDGNEQIGYITNDAKHLANDATTDDESNGK